MTGQPSSPEAPGPGAPSAEDMRGRILSPQTISRSCLPGDVADALAFLVSDGAVFITG